MYLLFLQRITTTYKISWGWKCRFLENVNKNKWIMPSLMLEITLSSLEYVLTNQDRIRLVYSELWTMNTKKRGSFLVANIINSFAMMGISQVMIRTNRKKQHREQTWWSKIFTGTRNRSLSTSLVSFPNITTSFFMRESLGSRSLYSATNQPSFHSFTHWSLNWKASKCTSAAPSSWVGFQVKSHNSTSSSFYLSWFRAYHSIVSISFLCYIWQRSQLFWSSFDL